MYCILLVFSFDKYFPFYHSILPFLRSIVAHLERCFSTIKSLVDFLEDLLSKWVAVLVRMKQKRYLPEVAIRFLQTAKALDVGGYDGLVSK